MASSNALPTWFEVGKTQELELLTDEAILDPHAMLDDAGTQPIRISHLRIETSPQTTDYIRVMFREHAVPSGVSLHTAKRSHRSWLAVAMFVFALSVLGAMLF